MGRQSSGACRRQRKRGRRKGRQEFGRAQRGNLGYTQPPLVTKQTGPEGKKVHQVLIEEGVNIDREFYLAVVIDRSKARPVVIFSQAGAWRSKRWLQGRRNGCSRSSLIRRSAGCPSRQKTSFTVSIPCPVPTP